MARSLVKTGKTLGLAVVARGFFVRRQNLTDQTVTLSVTIKIPAGETIPAWLTQPGVALIGPAATVLAPGVKHRYVESATVVSVQATDGAEKAAETITPDSPGVVWGSASITGQIG